MEVEVRVLFAAFLAAHGVAHLVGFLGAWGWLASAQVPHRTTILFGRVDLGEVGIRVFGVLWLLLAVGFLMGGWGVAASQAGVARWLIAMSSVSIAACILAWPDARIGVAVNAAVLVVVAYAVRSGWLGLGL